MLPFSASIIPVLTNTDVCCPVPLLKQGVSQFRKRRKPQPEALDVPTTINCFFRIWRFGAVENICPNSTKGPSMSKNIVSQVYSLKDFTGNPQFLRRTFEAFDFAEDCVTTTGARPYNKSSFQRRRLGTWTWTIWSACHDATALRQVAWFRDLGAAANLHCVKIILCFTGSWLVIQVILFSGGPITGCPEVKHIEAKTDAKARLSEMRVLIQSRRIKLGWDSMQVHNCWYCICSWFGSLWSSWVISTSHGYGGCQRFGKEDFWIFFGLAHEPKFLVRSC